ncbi:MAG: ABC transporter permease [Bacteroidota bacterium]
MTTSIKLFFRNLKRNRLFALVNILGLTAGFFTSILIYLYVQCELSYDQFHEKGDRIYRINQTFIWGEDNSKQFSSTGPGVAYSIIQEIPEAEEVVRIHPTYVPPITFELNGQEKFFKDEEIFAVDSNFFKVFDFPLLYGDEKYALKEPRSVILKYETAIRFFGNLDVIGELISMGKDEPYIITGVLEKIEQNSYLDDFDLLISMNSVPGVAEANWSWMWTTFETFVLFEQGIDIKAAKEKIVALPKTQTAQTLSVMGYTWEGYIEVGKEWNLYLQPFKDIRLHSVNIYNRLSDPGDIKIVAALIGSAIFLLILSCINFINLSTAQFTSRAKDVALRKVLGGTKKVFIQRFFGESFAYCIISLALAFCLTLYAIPFINQSLNVDLSFGAANQPLLVCFFTLLVAVVSVVAGFYPFLFFNAFKPTSAMKGEFKTGKKGLKLRNGMLIVQYSLSFILILGTFTVYQQLNHFMNVDVGYEKENLLIVRNAHWTEAEKEFANELAQLPGVTGTSLCDATPTIISNGDQFIPDIPNAGSFPLNFAVADNNYEDVLGLKLTVGRFFNKSYSSDSTAVILNETAVRSIGWKPDETVLNRKIKNHSGTYHVIGVVKDFNFWSLHGPIEPFGIFDINTAAGYDPLNMVLVKATGDDNEFNELIGNLETKWREFVPNRPFEHTVLSEHYKAAYRTEAKFGGVLSFFAVLTIIVASLGLFGIVVFSIEQKLKEIGVRKVLGASLTGLIVLFSKNYMKLLLIAFIIASPIGYYLMKHWLSDFEYRIQMRPSVFILSFLILLIISLVISVFHTTKASMLNPAEVLKDE